MHKSPPPTRRVVLAVVAMIASLIVPTVAAGPASGAPPSAPNDDKFTADAREALSEAKTADFWVRLDGKADLAAAAPAGTEWAARGTAVYQALRSTADQAQSGIRAALDKAGADYQAYWITNAILVREGSLALAESLATRTRRSPRSGRPPATRWRNRSAASPAGWRRTPSSGASRRSTPTTSGRLRHHAARASSSPTSTPASTCDHPALAGQYRGNHGGGTFDHDYNWFDVAGVCSRRPRATTDGHGTHTMGTMVGDDGAGNQIGVAPGANWIAANGCDTCSDADLIASGEWMLAPDRPRRPEPRPDERPHIVNNSWGSQLPTQRPVHGGHHRGLGGRRHLRRAGPTATAARLRDQRIAGQPDDHATPSAPSTAAATIAGLLRPWPRPGRRDQAEHRGARRERPLVARRRRLRRLQRHLDGRTARRRRRRAAVVVPRRPWSATSTAPGRCWTRPRSTSTTPPAVAPPTTTTCWGEGKLDAAGADRGRTDRRRRQL